jgi:hypothetical protein
MNLWVPQSVGKFLKWLHRDIKNREEWRKIVEKVKTFKG